MTNNLLDSINPTPDILEIEREKWRIEQEELRHTVTEERRKFLNLKSFLNNLYQGVTEDSRIIINPRMGYDVSKGRYENGFSRNKTGVIRPKDYDKFYKFISKKYCFFYGVNTVDKNLKDNHFDKDGVKKPFTGKASSKDIKEVVALYVDIDKVTEDEFYNQRLIKVLNLLPSAIIKSSGNGYHLYWFLKSPIDAQSKKAEVEETNSLLAKMVGGDSTQNIDRVLRLPDSYHTKTGNPVKVEIIKNDGTLRYTLEEIRDFIRSQSVFTPPTEDKDNGKGNGKDKLTFLDSLDIRISNLRLPDNILSLINNYVPKGERSEADMSIMNSLKYHGATRKLTQEIFKNKPCGEKYRQQGEGYFNLTWDKAEAWYEEEVNKKRGVQSYTPSGEIAVTVNLALNKIDYEQTDMGNSERFSKEHKDRARYCYKWGSHGSWLIWTGKRWKVDDGDNVDRLAKRTVRGIYQEAINSPSDKERENLLRYAKVSSSQIRREAMIKGARSEEGITVNRDIFNKKLHLLNVMNGTIDLKTGNLLPFNKEDYITQISHFSYDPNAKCPKWLSFLDDVMHGSKENIDYLQRAVGFSITGEISSQAFFILWGDGENGKSTFMNVIKKILGDDYALQSTRDTLLQRTKYQGGASNDLAELRDFRLLYAHETESGAKINEALIKQVTGGEDMRARALYQENEEFTPTFKIWIASNYKPVIRGVDRGIWRRVRFIPWVYTVDPKKKVDNYYKVLLREEGAGILRWAIEGAVKWYADGLGDSPKEIADATKDYASEMNPLDRFTNELTEKDINGKIRSGDFYRVWNLWREENQEYEMPPRLFKQKMELMGIVIKKKPDANYYLGIRFSQVGKKYLERVQERDGITQNGK